MLAVFWSGDGGWAELPDRIGRELARQGVAVVGVNSHRWLGKVPRTPQEAAHDTERLLRYYLARWDRSTILLMGFSRGAEFVPFIVNRLPADLRQRISLAGLLGAERMASFEFHLSDLVTSTARATDLPAKAEIERSTGVHYFCLYGTREADSVCRDLDPGKVTILARVGDHHFDGRYESIVDDLLRAVASRAAQRDPAR
jgi:type IV secretory pathway VirJ component